MLVNLLIICGNCWPCIGYLFCYRFWWYLCWQLFKWTSRSTLNVFWKS